MNADDRKWQAATVVAGPSGALSSQSQPPVRITKILKPFHINEIAPGLFIADFGQNFAGVARIRVKGKAGTKIKLKYGEGLHSDGTLNYLTTTAGQIKEMWKVNGGPGAPATAWQEDNYTLKGGGVEEWSPRFTFHGFRYVEISGWPGKPDTNSVEALRMNSDLPEDGKFSCSNSMFNQIHEAVKWTFLSNVFSVQSDCPGREKLGYGADIVATANAFMYNFNMSRFYRKTVRDFANDQRPDGGITETAPYIGIGDKGYGGGSGPLGWQLAFPYLQQQRYLFYGDERIIEENYPMVQKQMEFLRSHAIDGLFHWDIGDHEALDTKAEGFSAAAFYYHHALLAKQFAQILRRGDTLQYAALADRIRNDIVRKYYLPGTGRFDNATQSAQLFALWYGLSPEKEKTLQVLMDEFKRHNDHVSCGIFGVKMMFDVLPQLQQNEEAYRIANQKDFPGWGYMLSQGATTLWETWKYPDNAPSQNHPMFGSIDEWFYRTLLGISPAAPGFEKVTIKPHPSADLLWAKGSYHSVKGKIESDWKVESNQFSLKISIPPDAKAEVWIPCQPGGAVTEDGVLLTADHGLRITAYKDGYAIVETGSGNYSFQSALH
jgi:alpha-L-rhamnosidase